MIENLGLRTWAEVDLDAVGHNFGILSKLLPDGVLKMAIVKADAYGHGACRIAKYLEDKADFFGVASVDEAIELREGGISNSEILVLGHTSPSGFSALTKYKITPTFWNFDEVMILRDFLKKNGEKADIHIALDTGMNRIGFAATDESIREISEISKIENIRIKGLFSHFADSDNGDDLSFTYKQLEIFRGFTKKLEASGVKIPIRHIFNSAAITELNTEFELVREGIYLYGIAPSDTVTVSKVKTLKPAMSLRSEIIHIHEIEKGTSVGYGCTFIAPRKMKIATVCAGYADGVPRALSNKGEVAVNGKRAKIIGRICMDQFMCDVTDIEDAKIGTAVTVFGKDGDCEITCTEISSAVGTIPYEIICGISKRVPRVYFSGGNIDCIHYGIPHVE